jgi:hypothetical protein
MGGALQSLPLAPIREDVDLKPGPVALHRVNGRATAESLAEYATCFDRWLRDCPVDEFFAALGDVPRERPVSDWQDYLHDDRRIT